MQSRSCAALWTPPRSINASRVFEHQLNRTLPVSRKVWSAIVFGFELEMLRLHLAALADAVDGFSSPRPTPASRRRRPSRWC